MPVAYQPVFAFYTQPVLLPWIVRFEVNVLDVHSVLLGCLQYFGPEGHALVCLRASIPNGDHLTSRSAHALLHLGIHIEILSLHQPAAGSLVPLARAVRCSAPRPLAKKFARGDKAPVETPPGLDAARMPAVGASGLTALAATLIDAGTAGKADTNAREPPKEDIDSLDGVLLSGARGRF